MSRDAGERLQARAMVSFRERFRTALAAQGRAGRAVAARHAGLAAERFAWVDLW